jgi:6-phosphogluconolactonase
MAVATASAICGAAIPRVFAQPATGLPPAATLSRGPAMFAYVGSRTTRERNARGDGISVFRVNPANGSLDPVQVVGDLVNPSYLLLDAGGERLYTVHGDESEVSAFRVDRASGRLSFLNRRGTGGKNPVHLALDPTGRFLVVTNHIGASLAVLPVAGDGSLAEASQLVPFSGPIGPHRIEQKQAKPHFNLFDPSGRFVIVPDKGLDRVFTFRFKGGVLTPGSAPFIATREGAGPRHAAFHPAAPFAYVVNELDSTVTTYRYTAQTGALQALQILPTLPSSYTGNSRAAGIMVDRTGRTLYASNRGHDSIAVFRIDASTGLLDFAGADPAQGRTPRFFTLSPDGRLLFTLNEDSDSIVAFAVDAASGRLSQAAAPVKCGSPVCMVFPG